MIVLVTGGASGLGEAITRKIAQDANYRVYFTYYRSEINAKRIEKEFPNCFAVKCNFKEEAEVNAFTATIAGLNIDVLINNAWTGSFIDTYFHKTQTEDFLRAFKENIIPTIGITRGCINLFRKKKQGKIITILTAALINTPPLGTAVYTASKAYLAELVKVWATENLKYNITSAAVSPSFMLTGLTSGMDERVIEQIKNSRPNGQLLTTAEVAESVFHLLSATAAVNGVNLVVNGGDNNIR